MSFARDFWFIGQRSETKYQKLDFACHRSHPVLARFCNRSPEINILLHTYISLYIYVSTRMQIFQMYPSQFDMQIELHFLHQLHRNIHNIAMYYCIKFSFNINNMQSVYRFQSTVSYHDRYFKLFLHQNQFLLFVCMCVCILTPVKFVCIHMYLH